jgi:hypothetical protein
MLMCAQMVDGLGALPGVVGGVDGADDLWCASAIRHSILLCMLTSGLARHLVSQERLPFTATYFGSIALTLYFALGVSQSQSVPIRLRKLTHAQLQSTILTLLAAIVQLAALVWYLISYFPMGSTGLRFAARFGTDRVGAWMNN